MTGLVLEGGGVRGAYQVGAFMAFKKCGIKFDGIVGASIGSFNGAMLAAHKEKELLEFWKSIDVAKILGIDEDFAKTIQNKKINKEFISGVFNVVKQGGFKMSEMRRTLETILPEESVRKSKIEFGLVTLRIKKMKQVEIFKEDIPMGKLDDYILASCYLPVFKYEKIIDDNYYFDGGIFNNSPVNMLVDKNYKKIYVVQLGGIGRYPHHDFKQSEVVFIKPRKALGSIVSIDPKRRARNIKMGYYDTMKIIRKLDGFKYIFKVKSEFFYKFISRKIKKSDLVRVQKYFKTENYKDTILKSLEHVLLLENIEDLNIYHPYRIIKMIKNDCPKNNFIYNFIRKLRVL